MGKRLRMKTQTSRRMKTRKSRRMKKRKSRRMNKRTSRRMNKRTSRRMKTRTSIRGGSGSGIYESPEPTEAVGQGERMQRGQYVNTSDIKPPVGARIQYEIVTPATQQEAQAQQAVYEQTAATSNNILLPTMVGLAPALGAPAPAIGAAAPALGAAAAALRPPVPPRTSSLTSSLAEIALNTQITILKNNSGLQHNYSNLKARPEILADCLYKLGEIIETHQSLGAQVFVDNDVVDNVKTAMSGYHDNVDIQRNGKWVFDLIAEKINITYP